jgi:D-lactate dehydrogenase (cytochrome)
MGTRSEGLATLASRFGDRLTTSFDARRHHGEDQTGLHPGLLPDAVLFAESTEDVVAAMEICTAHRLPVVPFGGGTSLEGHIAAVEQGLSIDLSRMDQILRVSPEDMDCTVQPGISRQALNVQLRDTGLFFPIDACPEASIGGMASTRASGTNAVRYGTMLDTVLGLKAVLADGRIVTAGGRARKSAAGYDLTRLFVGSAGTLGVITELTVRLHPVPEHIVVAVAAFPTVVDAVNAVTTIIQLGTPIAKVEILDSLLIEASNRLFGTDLIVGPTLFFEFAGTEATVAEQVALSATVVEEFGGKGFQPSTSREERNRLWDIRHRAGGVTMMMRPGCMAFATDVTVPISRLAECIGETKRDLDSLPMQTAILGHVGDGNFHLVIPIDPNALEEMKLVHAFNDRLVSRAIAMEGTCTGEHGVGLGKMQWMEREFGEVAIDVMRSIKGALDPLGLMNPGKIFPPSQAPRLARGMNGHDVDLLAGAGQ